MIILIIIIIINQDCGKFFKFGFIMEYLNIFLFLQIVIEVLMDVVVWAGICGVLRVCIKSIQAVLATRVSPDNSGVILMGLLFIYYVTFFSCNSKYTFSVLYIQWFDYYHGEFPFSIFGKLCFSFYFDRDLLLQFGETLLYDFFKIYFLSLCSGFFLFLLFQLFINLVFLFCLRFPACFVPGLFYV